MSNQMVQNEFLMMSYLALSFGPEDANKLFNKFIGSRDFRSAPPGIVRYQDASYRAAARPNIVLDYHGDQKGTVVPQKMWQPSQHGDVHRHFRDASIMVPVFFIRLDYVIGVDMSHIVNARTGTPVNIFHPTVPAPMGGLACTHICIKWPGYGQEFRKQVELRDGRQVPITMSKLVERVSSVVQRFIDEAARWPIDPAKAHWRVGPGFITRDLLYIVGLAHVSAGTWQPILQLKGMNFIL